MEETLILNGVKYISSKRASELTGYAKDYIGQMCRGGKVDAKLVGRNWYVNEYSINNHKERGKGSYIKGDSRSGGIGNELLDQMHVVYYPETSGERPLNPEPVKPHAIQNDDTSVTVSKKVVSWSRREADSHLHKGEEKYAIKRAIHKNGRRKETRLLLMGAGVIGLVLAFSGIVLLNVLFENKLDYVQEEGELKNSISLKAPIENLSTAVFANVLSYTKGLIGNIKSSDGTNF